MMITSVLIVFSRVAENNVVLVTTQRLSLSSIYKIASWFCCPVYALFSLFIYHQFRPANWCLMNQIYA
ncbi:hypothetical protein RJT34_20337 [Clitoria ternatea]|uniref:Uncharacterized protein n=1 Tax=Clitoria ternatea TaxID=43366 RepID=A0AAN9ISQ9_CLITE